ncbi:MAG TPA: magnesium transporter [Isosphaeraceae bacterium]|nr:magnesium transporter [Isosphaeraceae bacterium]
MLEKLLLPEVKELLEANDLSTLDDVLNTWLAADLGGLVQALAPDEQVQILRILRPPLTATTFAYLESDTQERLLEALGPDEAARILNDMAPDDRTALLEELPAALRERLLGLLSPGERAVAQSLLEYAEDSVGRLMTPDFVAVRPDWTMRRVLDHVREYGTDSETLNVIYIVDDQNRLIDDLRIREVLLAPLGAHARDLIDNRFVCLNVDADKKTAVDLFRKYDRTALPVIDHDGRLVGIVTIDDVLDVAEEAATREIQRFGGVEALDDPYMSTPLPAMVRKRASWLVVLFLGEMLTATAMGYFQVEIAKAVVLALFVPLIISSGGNSGSQAATLIIRALALGEVRLGQWWLVMRRELISGLALGTILGSIGFLRIALWSSVSNLYGPHWVLVGLTVALSLVGIVLWGTLSGSMLPFLLKSLGFDPATSSAPFVATLVDVTGLIIYFTVALIVLKGTLL